jgi:hypothetical protein
MEIDHFFCTEHYICFPFRASALVMAKHSRNSPYCGTEQSILQDHAPPSQPVASRTTVPALLTSLSRHHIVIAISSRMHARSHRNYKNPIQPHVAGPQHISVRTPTRCPPIPSGTEKRDCLIAEHKSYAYKINC